MSRSIGTEAAITMPSAIDAMGRLKMIMRSTGVVRQRRAPTTERRARRGCRSGARPAAAAARSRHAAEGEQDRGREHERDGIQQQDVVGRGERRRAFRRARRRRCS